MLTRRCRMIGPVVFLAVMPAASGVARAQFSGYGFPTAGYGTGYGGAGASGYGYGVRTGQIGNGYRSAGQFYPQPSYSTRPQTTISFGPLESAITLLPGWNGSTTTHRVRRRLHTTQSRAPRISPFKDDGTILWPSTVPNDLATQSLRRDAEAAVRAVVLEKKTSGHGSVRPVIDAKKKLSAFERMILPEVRAKNVTDSDALETFFFDLDNALDTMTYTY